MQCVSERLAVLNPSPVPSTTVVPDSVRYNTQKLEQKKFLFPVILEFFFFPSFLSNTGERKKSRQVKKKQD